MKTKRTSAASAGEADDREREAIIRDLDDLAVRVKAARQRGTEDAAVLTAAVASVRLRMIALARAEGGLAWPMRPDDEYVGGNVMKFRRRR